MASLQQAISIHAYQPVSADGGVSYPVGDYPAIITANEITGTRSNESNGCIMFTGKFIDGPYNGQTFKWQLNIYHSNETASRIAFQQLASLGLVLGIDPVHNLDLLHGKPFQICYRPRKDEPEKTQVAGCKDIYGRDPGRQNDPIPNQNNIPIQAIQQPMQQPAQQHPMNQPANQQPWNGGIAGNQPMQQSQPVAGVQMPAQQQPAQNGQPWNAQQAVQQPATGGNPNWQGGNQPQGQQPVQGGAGGPPWQARQ